MNGRPKTVPHPAIPFSFFATGLAAIGGAILWPIVQEPSRLALLHLLVVGGYATIAMGALYQFVPVVGMSTLRGAPFAFVHLMLAVAGTCLIVSGFALSRPALLLAGGELQIAGIVIQVAILGATLWRGSRAVPARGASLALGWFAATAVAGSLLADRLQHGLPTGRLVGVHALLGLAGFFGTLIATVSFRLLRMFERYDLESRTALRGISVGAAAALAIFFGRAGTIALIAVALLLAGDLIDVLRHRSPAYQRETLLYTIASSAGAIGAAIAAFAGWWYGAVVLAAWFFVGCAVVGYIQRIVPFIWWIQRARREGVKHIPTLGRMNQSQLGHAILALWVVAGVWMLAAPLDRGPAFVALAAWIALLAQLSRPFVLRR